LRTPPISPTRRFAQKGRVLRCRDRKDLRDELVKLIEKQIEMLAKQSCDSLTEVELREYDDRRERIEELYDALGHLDFAA
jgi:DNA-binding MarR family transcriptional regulator